jgi:hypothetical protein
VTAVVGQLTGPERALRAAAAALLVVSVGFAVVYFVKGITGPAEFPYATNSVAKDALFAGLAYLIVRDVRRWAGVAVPLIVLAHVLMPFVMISTALLGGPEGIGNTWSSPPQSASAFRLGWIAADVVVAVGFVWLYRRAYR